MTAPVVLKVSEAQLRQCPYRGAMPCSTTACMAWCTTAKGAGYCVLLAEPKP